jgi:peptidyl-prolyl cis-trans isomerase SurA
MPERRSMSRSFKTSQLSVFILLASSLQPAFAVERGKAPVKPILNSKPVTQKKGMVLDRLEASVNSAIILRSDVLKFRETLGLRGKLDPLFSGSQLASKGNSVTDKEIVDFLVNDKLISQQFPKTEAEVEQEINSIQANNHLDRSSLKAALEREGYKFGDYFELIRGSSSKRDLIDRDIATKVKISDDDIKNYFYNHYVRNTAIPRAYELRIISVFNSSFKTVTAAKQAAMDALKSIRAGEEFEEVAKRASDDPTASSGGDLGVMTEDQMSNAIREQVKKLQIGQVSEIFTGGSSDRFHIVKLVSVRSSENDRLEKMKNEIRSQLTANEYQHQIDLWLERQRQTAFIHKAGEQSAKEIPLSPSLK